MSTDRAPETASALDYLGRLARFGVRLGLERMRGVLEALGQPHRAYRWVHVAGTNGKGSTAAMIASMARAAGIRTALYTSPHLVRFHERIVVDGAPITDEELVRAYRRVREAVDRAGEGGELPTHFEFVTAMALWHFAQAGVELAVVEVGLGGRLDATNVVEEPEVTAITPLSLDHTAVLGSRLEQIAAEKAGILKPGADAVLAPQAQAAREVVAAAARKVGAPLFEVEERTPGPDGRAPANDGRSYVFASRHVGPDGGRLELWAPGGVHYESLAVPLLGPHQLVNAATAVAVADRLASRGWPITAEAVARGLQEVRWPGRLQVIGKRPVVVVDGAHNPQAAAALARALEQVFGRPASWLVIGMLAEKDVKGVLRHLVRPTTRVVATRARSSRTTPIDPHELAALASQMGARTAVSVMPAREALRYAVGRAEPEDLVVVAGSLYLAGEILEEGLAVSSPSASPSSTKSAAK
ncbi:MAG: bifunctional folylpolyglutamate synthase/dihydrofolate synthase [Limnochordaceae bacterium]|nr:bifunctional folylpolyglutamate synthase/dihydrofolate synthase [Limnochordaceae bacterium]